MPVSAIFNKFPGIVKYKPLILFVLKTLVLFFAFLFVKFIHRTLIAPSNTSILSSYLREINIYVLVSDTITYPVQWLINLLGYPTIISERVIAIVGHSGVIIHAPCMGFNIFSIFIALIIAYPSSAKLGMKLLFILGGIIGIHLLNILRVFALTIKDVYPFELWMEHHDLYNIIIYSFVFILFYFWIKYYSNASVKVTEE